MKLSSLKVDAGKIETGAWVNKIPEFGGARLKVRGFGNTDDLRIQADEMTALPRAERLEGVSQTASFKIMTKRLEAVLLDWDGFVDEDDKPLPFSKELAAQMLPDPNFIRFRDAVFWAANVVGEQRKADEAAVEKN